jgi:hypothetical protein
LLVLMYRHAIINNQNRRFDGHIYHS